MSIEEAEHKTLKWEIKDKIGSNRGLIIKSIYIIKMGNQRGQKIIKKYIHKEQAEQKIGRESA